MKKVIASAGLLALGAAGIQNARADWAAGSDKPWSISGTLRGFYDDNINTAPDGPAKIDSFGFEVRPSANYAYSDGPTSFKASVLYALYYYGARPGGTKYDQDVDAELSMSHSFNERYVLGVIESFVDAQDPQVLAGTAALSTPLRANGDNYHNAFGITFSAQVTRLLQLVLGYNNNFYDYTGNVPAQLTGQPDYGTLLNRMEHLVTLDSRWIIQEDTTGVLGYSFGAVDYLSTLPITPTGAPTLVLAPTRNNYSDDVYIGVDHTFSPELTLSVRVGIQVLDYYNSPPGSSPSSTTPYAQLSVNYTYMDGGTLSFGFNHLKNQTDVAYDPTSLNPGVTQDEESSSISASVVQVLKPLSPKLTATATFQFQDSNFNGGGYNNETDNIYLFGLNFAYQFTQFLSSEIGYNYSLVDSDVPSRGYNRNQVYIGVTATY